MDWELSAGPPPWQPSPHRPSGDSPDWNLEPTFESLLLSPTDFSSETDDIEETQDICATGDPDWEEDDLFVGKEEDCTSVDSKLVKNKKERERMKHKRVLLEKLVSYLKASSYISEANKKRRFTEAYTVSLTISLIQALEEESTRLGGGRKPMEQQAAGLAASRSSKRKKKPSNAFICFSAHYRPCFVHVLREVSMDECGHAKNPSQKIVQKVAAKVWKRLKDKGDWRKHSMKEIREWSRDFVNSDLY